MAPEPACWGQILVLLFSSYVVRTDNFTIVPAVAADRTSHPKLHNSHFIINSLRALWTQQGCSLLDLFTQLKSGRGWDCHSLQGFLTHVSVYCQGYKEMQTAETTMAEAPWGSFCLDVVSSHGLSSIVASSHLNFLNGGSGLQRHMSHERQSKKESTPPSWSNLRSHTDHLYVILFLRIKLLIPADIQGKGN